MTGKRIRCGLTTAMALCLVVVATVATHAAPVTKGVYQGTKALEAYVKTDSSFNDSKVTACDIDGCGKDELLVGNMGGNMYCFTSTGKTKWVKNVGASIRGAAACYDVDGDGKKEVFFGDMNGVVCGLGCNCVTLSQW